MPCSSLFVLELELEFESNGTLDMTQLMTLAVTVVLIELKR